MGRGHWPALCAAEGTAGSVWGASGSAPHTGLTATAPPYAVQ